MQKFQLAFGGRTDPRILCLGAHSDDIEIGCGGTVLRLLAAFPDAAFRWVVFAAPGQRKIEAAASAERFLHDAKNREIVLNDYEDGFFPYNGAQIKRYFEHLKQSFIPDIVLTHWREDAHQDHRLIGELTWNTFRNHFILEYEIAKYDGDVGNPNFFVELDESLCRRKVDTILESFVSQREKAWFTGNTFFALLRLRGLECNAAQRHAEAFYCRKAVW